MWSPMDQRIACARYRAVGDQSPPDLSGSDLIMVDPATGAVAPLAIHPRRYVGMFHRLRTPRFSPDGLRIAFVGEGISGESALFCRPLVGATSTVDRSRFDQYADSDLPCWRPDGDALVFRQGLLRAPTADHVETVRSLEPGGRGGGELLRLQVGSAPVLVPAPSGLRVTGIAWSPDGALLAISVSSDPMSVLFADAAAGVVVSVRENLRVERWVTDQVALGWRTDGGRLRPALVDGPLRRGRQEGVSTGGVIDGLDAALSPNGQFVAVGGGEAKGPDGPCALRVPGSGLPHAV